MEEVGGVGDRASGVGDAPTAGAQTLRDGLKPTSGGMGDGMTSTH